MKFEHKFLPASPVYCSPDRSGQRIHALVSNALIIQHKVGRWMKQEQQSQHKKTVPRLQNDEHNLMT
jgi:hypothetical protein